MPPVTPSRTRRPASGLLDPNPFGALGLDLPLGDLLQGDGERLVLQAARLDEWRNVLASALTELVVIGVDLPSPPGRQDDQRVLGVDLRQQVVDLRFDHGCARPSARGPGRLAYSLDLRRRLVQAIVHHDMVELRPLGHLRPRGSKTKGQSALVLGPPGPKAPL